MAVVPFLNVLTVHLQEKLKQKRNEGLLEKKKW
jgi:hypothetical protein